MASHIVNNTKNLKRIKTERGWRWYDVERGCFARLEVPKFEGKLADGARKFFKDNVRRSIEIQEKQVITEEAADGQVTRRVRDFTDRGQAEVLYRKLVIEWINAGWRNWNNREGDGEKFTVRGRWGQKIVDGRSGIRFARRRCRDPISREVGDRVRRKKALPAGYMEMTKDNADRFKRSVGLLSKFIIQGKRSNAVKDIRELAKSKKIYSSIEYKVNYALDVYEDLGMGYARWCNKKTNQMDTYLHEGTQHGRVAIKTSNMIAIVKAFIEMMRVLKEVLLYYDPREPWQVKMMGRKKFGGPIRMRPKKLPTVRFFREGRQLYTECVEVWRIFKLDCPEFVQRYFA